MKFDICVYQQDEEYKETSFKHFFDQHEQFLKKYTKEQESVCPLCEQLFFHCVSSQIFQDCHQRIGNILKHNSASLSLQWPCQHYFICFHCIKNIIFRQKKWHYLQCPCGCSCYECSDFSPLFNSSEFKKLIATKMNATDSRLL